MTRISRRSSVHKLSTGTTLRTQIPQVIGEMLGISPGEELEWTVDTATGRVTVRKAPAERAGQKSPRKG